MTRSPGVEFHWLRQMPSLANRVLDAYVVMFECR